MTACSELREKVEGASGPSRELDAHIAAATGLPMLFCDFEAGSYHGDCVAPGCGKPLGFSDERRSYPSRWEDDDRLPQYTASIDAALALVERVLPGWVWQVIKIDGVPSRAPLPDCEARLWIPSVRTQKLRVESVDGKGATPPLAILSALLRALDVPDTGHGG